MIKLAHAKINRLRFRAGGLYERLYYRRFYTLAHAAQGMLTARTYRRLYAAIYSLPDLAIIEIGGGAGASSIAIAWAMRDSGKRSKLIVVEKCEDGSRSEFGGYEQNLARITANFAKFGVSDQIRLFPHVLTPDNGDAVKAMVDTSEIAALVIDADGLLDRDFALFWPLLQTGGLMVIDDYENRTIFKPVSDYYPLGGGKHLRTFRLLNLMIDWGLFVPNDQIGSTIFGIKPAGADFARFDLEQCKHTLAELEREREAWLARSGAQQTV